MSEPKWTLSPLRIERNPFDRRDNSLLIFTGTAGSSKVLARISEGREPTDEDRANTQLWVTASGMYEALETIVRQNDEFRRHLPADWESDPINDACEAAKPILAKAREQS